jgi:hypothetical protein
MEQLEQFMDYAKFHSGMYMGQAEQPPGGTTGQAEQPPGGTMDQAEQPPGGTMGQAEQPPGGTMEQLKQLMDYTKFHIGMYITLSTALVAVLGMDAFKSSVSGIESYLFLTLICFLLAGMFGGLVGSSIPYYQDFDSFSKARLGPFRKRWIPAKLCTHLEHLAFWIGIIISVWGLYPVMHKQPESDLRLMSWGDGSGVPASGSNLVVVGTDDDNRLHIRIFDAAGKRVTDTVETEHPSQAGAIAALKEQLRHLLPLPPHVLTDAEKKWVIRDATSIVGQTQQPVPPSSQTGSSTRKESKQTETPPITTRSPGPETPAPDRPHTGPTSK